MNITYVSDYLLTPNNIKNQDLYDILQLLTERDLDYADLYFQSCHHETWELENRIIKKGTYNVDRGVGIRAVYNDKTGFAYANEITLAALHKSANAAKNIINQNGKKQISSIKTIDFNNFYSNIDPMQTMSHEEKIALLYRIDRIAREENPFVQEVDVILSSVYEYVLVVATDGTMAADIRPLVHLSVNVLVDYNGKRERASSGGGGRYGYQYFLEIDNNEIRAEHYAREAVRIALINISSIPAPAGAMTVVLGSGWPGILLHEAVGHGLEGDFNRRKTSVFSNKIGQKVASSLCTVVDDATLIGHRGSLSIDDEGVPGQYNILIENGILKGYMQDKMNARLMGVLPTGNGRRESYASLPMPRMTNTYMLGGNYSPEEIIYSVDFGIYASNFSSGQVDITSGKFVFSTAEAYLIEKGKVTKPIKRATLIGEGKEIMQQISMIGNDLKFDNGVGVCGKEGQNIPVGVGQPTLKIDNITVGGTA
ncbi:metalloprotease TldD [Arsenophonus endosymbiont of Lipoptena cervi]|uniref:metalloprotease TldD n=1 Tax=Arsenophonus endosymbiont of Lipoptena cervi TaxID=363258 RepID=UPI00376EB16A